MNRPELLSPAGSPDGVRAAVQSGADAVYMGFGTFNARRGAKGFTENEMAEAIAYCRARGVKTHITLNILTADRELDSALKDAKFVYEAGADALIIQDLGLAQLVHSHAPEIALHASTQLTIHTLDGAKEMRELGFTRVVLSRECSREEVRLITGNAGIETEVFVHGALCMCYSGQCYMSSVIGRRSGNRGLCAQPCRLPYNGGYPLSLKDLALAGRIPELKEIGVTSLKLEGRLKRPEYTAVVTALYARLLKEDRAPTPEEWNTLKLVFSRDGFTDGYFTGKKGAHMFGVKTGSPPDKLKALYDEAGKRFAPGKEAPLVPVSMHLTARLDTGAVLNVDGVSTAAQVEKAVKQPADMERVEKSLRKTGGTPFYVEKVRMDVEGGLALPASLINALRRDALDLLMAKRAAPPLREWADDIRAEETGRPEQKGFLGFTASVRTRGQAEALCNAGLESIYAPPGIAAQTGSDVILPRVFSDSEQPGIEALLKNAVSRGAKSALIGNIGQIALVRGSGLELRGDFGLNAFNSASLRVLSGLGVKRQTLSFEARLAQLRDMIDDISGVLETEIVVYGYLPLMVFENCVSGKNAAYLTDRRNARFAVLPESGGRGTLLNSRPLCLAKDEFSGLKLNTARLMFTLETPEECVSIARAFIEGRAPECAEATKGLYKRGVE